MNGVTKWKKGHETKVVEAFDARKLLEKLG